jgi:tRNA 2-thiocytidine biosynthesis protein TtcA
MQESQTTTQKLPQRVKLRGVARYVYKKSGKAISDYRMIEDKDRILVGVSGGADSLSLLKMLLVRKMHIPVHFDIVACFIDLSFSTTSRRLLEDYFKKEGVPYVVKELDLKTEDVDCFWCSWNKRKLLFQTAKEHNCNKIALAHHLDDIVETILMNLFFHGEISCMKPKIELFGGLLSIIRPFSYLEKRTLESLAQHIDLPDTGHACRYAKNSRRELIKETIDKLKKQFPHIKTNIFRSLQRRKIREDYLP